MLVNSRKILLDAKINKYAVPHFNINNLEWAKYLLEVAEEAKTPIILGVSEGAMRYMGGFNTIVGMVKGLIKDLNIKVDICLHLDHGPSVDVCKNAIDAGFTSVMIDGSKYPLLKNIEITKEVVAYAKEFDVTVEGEVGCIGGSEDDIVGTEVYAKLDDCVTFYEATQVDSLAPALGSVHGLYKGEPKLDFETMRLISEALPIPLVLHGGTGIEQEKITKAISCGISKININTELQIAWHKNMLSYIKEHESQYDPRKVIGSGSSALKESAKSKINQFQNKIGTTLPLI